jgi:hypothetical protein
MRIAWLAWYICGVCLLFALLASAITYPSHRLPFAARKIHFLS